MFLAYLADYNSAYTMMNWVGIAYIMLSAVGFCHTIIAPDEQCIDKKR